MASLTIIKGVKEAPRAARSKMDTILVTKEQVEGWSLPPFQRPLRENEKVRIIAEELKSNGGMVPGVVTLGRLGNDARLYIVDGQHRIHAFKMSGLPEGIMDARVCDFESMADMAIAFVELNSSLVRMRPDDILRGMEGSSLALRTIRRACPFVGYDQIRRGNSEKAPMLSMSLLLRAWSASGQEAPSGAGASSLLIANGMDIEEVRRLIAFTERAYGSWGRDQEYARLWAMLNLSLCMWLWRRMVLGQGLVAGSRRTTLKADQFAQGLMAISANSDYLDWLRDRKLSERDRSPAYKRIKGIFSRRIRESGVAAPVFPAPAWMS